MGTRETIIVLKDETIEIWRHGKDDYSICFHNNDCSVRGTFLEIVEEYNNFIRESVEEE